MLGFDRWHLLKLIAATLCIFGIVSLALIYFIPAPPSKVVNCRHAYQRHNLRVLLSDIGSASRTPM